MRPISVNFQDVTAEVAGGWVMTPPPHSANDEMAIRLDDGQSAICLRDQGIAPGDRVYRAVYRGRALHRRIGVEIHDVTSDIVQASCRTAMLRTSYVYAGMAVVPVLVLAGLTFLRIVQGSEAISTGVLLTVSAAVIIPLLVWAMQSLLTRRANHARASMLEGCRRMVDDIIQQDVSIWKQRLVEALPSVAAPAQGTVIRGTACRIVEGISSVEGDVPELLRPGRPIPLPARAVAACRLEDGDLVHALIPEGRIPAIPLAVSSPLTGLTWTDNAIAGGPDGAPHRAAMRAALGRATWNIVTRQWDEIGRRRRDARRA